jgi:hypothetical protein
MMFPKGLIKLLFFSSALLSIASQVDAAVTKKVSCSPDAYNAKKIPAALLDAEILEADLLATDTSPRLVADVHSLMLVQKNGKRENADHNFKNSFWGELVRKGQELFKLEPNDEEWRGNVSRVATIQIQNTTTPKASFVTLKDKSVYYMDCKIDSSSPQVATR